VSSSQEALKAHILSFSVSDVFVQACKEWKLAFIYKTEELDHCPCGQPIKEHCEIANRYNGARTFVGNVCINRFLRLETATLFSGLRRIQEDRTANTNVDLIHYANERGFLYPGEFAFLLSTARKRLLSDKQLAWKEKINRRIIEQIVVRRLPRAGG
jgi:hypothetical protein